MGLPFSLDGQPDKLHIRKSVECPNCKRQVPVIRKGIDAEGRVIAVCGLCGHPIPQDLLIRKEN